MRHGVLKDIDMEYGNFLNSTGWHDHFLNSTIDIEVVYPISMIRQSDSIVS